MRRLNNPIDGQPFRLPTLDHFFDDDGIKQREAQHLKTLEKHEKERADFEKRRQQEEIEQNKRIEQLQKDWASRREAMRQKQAAESSVDGQPPVSNASSGAM